MDAEEYLERLRTPEAMERSYESLSDEWYVHCASSEEKILARIKKEGLHRRDPDNRTYEPSEEELASERWWRYMICLWPLMSQAGGMPFNEARFCTAVNKADIPKLVAPDWSFRDTINGVLIRDPKISESDFFMQSVALSGSVGCYSSIKPDFLSVWVKGTSHLEPWAWPRINDAKTPLLETWRWPPEV